MAQRATLAEQDEGGAEDGLGGASDDEFEARRALTPKVSGGVVVLSP